MWTKNIFNPKSIMVISSTDIVTKQIIIYQSPQKKNYHISIYIEMEIVDGLLPFISYLLYSKSYIIY